MVTVILDYFKPTPMNPEPPVEKLKDAAFTEARKKGFGTLIKKQSEHISQDTVVFYGWFKK